MQLGCNSKFITLKQYQFEFNNVLKQYLKGIQVNIDVTIKN